MTDTMWWSWSLIDLVHVCWVLTVVRLLSAVAKTSPNSLSIYCATLGEA